MSSSGLIYAVIVGAWAAYLVPMWLRRQDELNESRPTERFSTAIRLLAGRSAMERRAARNLDDGTAEHDTEAGADPTADGESDVPTEEPPATVAGAPAAVSEPDPAPVSVPDPAPVSVPAPAPDLAPAPAPDHASAPASASARREAAQRPAVERRARVLARRRRMVTLLFLAFAVGAVVAAVAGLAFIWAPAVPAVLLTFYIAHLRRLERQRFEVKLDRTRAAQAAERLHAREHERAHERTRRQDAAEGPTAHDATHSADPGRPHLRLAADPGAHGGPQEQPTSATSALAEATEHEEWVDGIRERAAAGPDSWEPVPVPLPTYVTAPVAPRTTRNLDLAAPNTWDSGRPDAAARKTPLFDQYAEPAPVEDDYVTRPRAANE